ncbi:MAG TPA: transglycosylase domain-containing protein, partial [Planctomycetota bacterium]|nr:transglycosylase domain-containing protein [Planctomycetota bacterium]
MVQGEAGPELTPRERFREAWRHARGRLREWWRGVGWPHRGPSWERFRRRAPLTRKQLTILGVVLGVLGFTLWERCGVRGCPNVERLVAYQPGGASVLLDRAGEKFADLSPVRREVVALESLPNHLKDAFVTVEDKRFHRHGGVDWRRFGGALLANIRAGGVSEGFSTITMQLARNIFPDRLPGQKRTLRRKILEVRVAREIEERFDKDEILELYLNHIYFGGGAYGVQAAARHYFAKDAEDLALHEAALLAALVKGPAVYDPRGHPDRARERRDLVLRVMEREGVITPEKAEAARERRLGVRREPPPVRNGDPPIAPYFAEAVRRVLEERFGEDIYTSTLKVYTTLDRTAQRAAEDELRTQLRAIERGVYGRFRGDRYDADDPPGAATTYLQGAVVVMDVDSGDVLALVGGRDFRQSRFDRATRARRQPGSAFKPFVYAVALAEGYAPTQNLSDEPDTFRLAGGEVWAPRNFNGEFEGFVSVRDALVRSKNVPTVRLSEAVGRGSVIRLARESGLHGSIPNTPSVALGTAGVSPLEMASAYAAFANGGNRVTPYGIERIRATSGGVLY